VLLQQNHPIYTTTIALHEHAETTWLLVKARRLVFATSTTTAVTPSYIQDRVARREPLPRVTLVPVTAGNKRAKKRRKFRSMLGFILGMNGGPKGEGMPCDVFRGVLMDFLMPVWDPLR